MKNEIILEQRRGLLREGGNDLRQKDFPYVLFDLVVHRLVHSLLTELTHSLVILHISEFRCHEFIVLCGNHDSVDAYRVIVLVIFDGELGFCVRPEIWHQVVAVLSDI